LSQILSSGSLSFIVFSVFDSQSLFHHFQHLRRPLFLLWFSLQLPNNRPLILLSMADEVAQNVSGPQHTKPTEEKQRPLAIWCPSDHIKFFNIDRSTWQYFQHDYLVPFSKKYRAGPGGRKTFSRDAVIKDADFLQFEQDVFASNPWAAEHRSGVMEKRLVFAQALRYQCDKLRRTEREELKERSRLKTLQKSSCDVKKEVHDAVRETKYMATATQTHDEIMGNDYLQPDISDEHLHIRITRQSCLPNLSYQTTVRALQKDSQNCNDIFRNLNYKKLQDCATLYLGFNIKRELLAIEYGPKKQLAWLFVQDDASLRSTIETWRLRHLGLASWMY